MNWRLKFTQCETDLQIQELDQATFDVWFLSRYVLSEYARENFENLSNNSLNFLKRVRKQKSIKLGSIWKLKRATWLFPHSGSMDANTGIDEYVFPNIISMGKDNYINCEFNGVDGIHLSRYINYPAFFAKIFLFKKNKNIRHIIEKYSQHFFFTDEQKRVLQNNIRLQYCKYILYNCLIRIFRPKTIIFGDRSDKFPLILSAKKMGVAMIECQHGLPMPRKFNYDFGELNSELFEHITFYCCFNFPKYNKFLDTLGMKTHNVQPRIERKKNGLYLNTQVLSHEDCIRILILSQSDFSKKLIKMNTLKLQKKSHIFVKPHPSEDRNFYEKHLTADHITVLEASSKTFYQVVDQVDFVMGFYSTALLEAKLVGKKVFIFEDGEELTTKISEMFDTPIIKFEEIQNIG